MGRASEKIDPDECLARAQELFAQSNVLRKSICTRIEGTEQDLNDVTWENAMTGKESNEIFANVSSTSDFNIRSPPAFPTNSLFAQRGGYNNIGYNNFITFLLFFGLSKPNTRVSLHQINLNKLNCK